MFVRYRHNLRGCHFFYFHFWPIMQISLYVLTKILQQKWPILEKSKFQPRNIFFIFFLWRPIFTEVRSQTVSKSDKKWGLGKFSKLICPNSPSSNLAQFCFYFSFLINFSTQRDPKMQYIKLCQHGEANFGSPIKIPDF